MPIRPHVLREYALLADGERGAMIGPDGDIAWLCFPGWADPAVLASLIGGAGTYAITPRGRYVWGGSYEPGTLIWRSRWVLPEGTVECREALAFPGERGTAVLLRRLIAVVGTVAVDVVFGLAADYGRGGPEEMCREEDIWCGTVGGHAFAWSGAAGAGIEDGGALHHMMTLEPGEHHDFVLTLGRGRVPVVDPHQDPDGCWQATEAAWRSNVPPPAVALAERDAHHARAVMRGLTAAGGGMVAAATMALPERAREGRSYDYRYAWVRDQAIAGTAAASAGADDLLDDAVAFLTARLLADGPQLAPAYTVSGGELPDEDQLGLPGYPGGAGVVGNRARGQFQLDAFGEALLCLAAADVRGRLEVDGWRAAQCAADVIATRHGEPDAGIWEIEPDHWTHSRLIGVAGLRALAARPAAGRQAPRWLALADRLAADADQALHPGGYWTRSPTDDRIDAALLFGGLRGATAPDDPRALATIDTVRRDLTEEFYAYRYRPDERELGQAEGAFLLCGFAMALALDSVGRHREAAHWFERNRSACGTPGLLAEEFDVRQRQLRGNLPQAFVHALLLECAATLPGTEVDRDDLVAEAAAS